MRDADFLSAHLQQRSSGPASTAASTEKERNRRADGRGEEDNEYGPVSASKPRKSTASSSSPILDLPIELYSFAETHAPTCHLQAEHHLIYHESGDVGNHRITIYRNTPANVVASFQRNSCNAMQMSTNPAEPPLIRFDFKDQCQSLQTIFDECRITPRDLKGK